VRIGHQNAEDGSRFGNRAEQTINDLRSLKY
jgi:hypothetical protein